MEIIRARASEIVEDMALNCFWHRHSFLEFTLQTDIQSPLNRQILKSSETVMYAVELLNNLITAFMGPENQNGIDVDEEANGDKPRDGYLANEGLDFGNMGQMFDFAKTIYNLMK